MLYRDVREDDWVRIAWLASDQAQEADHSLNRDWVANRKKSAECIQSVIERDGIVEAYCCLERFASDETFRAFLVLDWIELDEALAIFAHDRLNEMINGIEAREVWIRELAGDKKLLSFLKNQGFVVKRAYQLEGQDMVNLVRASGI